MEGLVSSLKRNLSFAAGTVFRGARAFACFFVALFLIETALSFSGFLADSALVAASGGAVDGEDWHIAYFNLNEEQSSYLLAYHPTRDAYDVFDVVRMQKNGKGSDARYDMYLRFTIRDVEKAQKIFREQVERIMMYFADSADTAVGYSTSSTYKLYFARAEQGALVRAIALASLGITAILAALLYGIRTRQERFVYGIYVTFGADMRRLAFMSGLELAVIAAATEIPALAAGAGIAALCVKLVGGSFAFCLRLALLSLPIAVFASFTAAFLCTRVLALCQPIKLLVAGDGGDTVASPRRSSVRVRNRFPFGYETLTLWRYRRYLLVTALSFAVFAAAAVFFATSARTLSDRTAFHRENGAEYTVTLGDAADEDAVVTALSTMDGVKTVVASGAEVDARMLSHLISVPKSAVNAVGICAGNPSNEEENLTDDFRILPATAESLAAYAALYDVTVDETVVFDENSVWITESAYNDTAFSFRTGDAVALWRFLYVMQPIEEGSTGVYKISQMAQQFAYQRTNLTVTGVIHNYPSSLRGITVFVSDTLYEKLTGTAGGRNTLSVICTPDADRDAVGTQVRALAAQWQIGEVTVTAVQSDADAAYATGTDRIFLVVSGAVVLLSMIPLGYALLLFYRKRRTEFAVLRTVFLPKRQLLSMHAIDAGVITVLAAALSLGFGFPAKALALRLWERTVVAFTQESVGILASRSFPWLCYLLICAAVFVTVFVTAALCYFNVADRNVSGERDRALADE